MFDNQIQPHKREEGVRVQPRAIVAVSVAIITITMVMFASGSISNVMALFPVENLNAFVSDNGTAPRVLNVVGEFTNTGLEREDYVDIAVVLYDNASKIIGVESFYEDDIKPGDTIPMRLEVPEDRIEGGNFSIVDHYKVTVD